MSNPQFFRAPQLSRQTAVEPKDFPPGKWSMSFSFDWSSLAKQLVYVPGKSFQGAEYVFDPYIFQSVYEVLGPIRSAMFSWENSFPADGNTCGGMYLFVPNTGMIHLVEPNLAAKDAVQPVPQPSGQGIVVNGCLPIIANERDVLHIIKEADTDGVLRGFLNMTIANYELPAYLNTGATDFA